MKEFWDNRYSEADFAYGENPNLFLKEQLNKLDTGKILFPAEGEGRNAVYAAKNGWNTFCFDPSVEGKNKADLFAKKEGVEINYDLKGFNEIDYSNESFDCVALIYAHMPSELRTKVHKKLASYVKKGGFVILEAFSKKQLELSTENPKAGGPKNIDMLFSVEDIKSDFEEFEILHLEEKRIELNEGLYHVGESSVIRFVGKLN